MDQGLLRGSGADFSSFSPRPEFRWRPGTWGGEDRRREGVPLGTGTGAGYGKAQDSPGFRPGTKDTGLLAGGGRFHWANSTRGGRVRAGLWGNFTAGGPGWQAAPSTLRERPVDTGGVSIRRGEARMPRASAGGEEIPLLPLWCQVSGGDRCPHPGSPAEPANVGSAGDCSGPLDRVYLAFRFQDQARGGNETQRARRFFEEARDGGGTTGITGRRRGSAGAAGGVCGRGTRDYVWGVLYG